MKSRFLIIAGSEKSGTTSLYQYLSDSQLFTPSKKKETDFFREKNYDDLDLYKACFANKGQGSQVYLEASPGYLADSKVVAKRLDAVLSDYHLVFCLRNPIDRLLSSFVFHKSRLYIPSEMTFEHYFDECMKYEADSKYRSVVNEWCLRVPDSGKYYKHLLDYEEINGHKSMTLVSFECLVKEPKDVMVDILAKLGLPSKFYDNYEFGQSNATQSHKNDIIQKVALWINSALEGIWLRNPRLKQFLLSIYKSINGAPKEKIILSDQLRARLVEYYSDDLYKLRESPYLKEGIVDGWLKKMLGGG